MKKKSFSTMMTLIVGVMLIGAFALGFIACEEPNSNNGSNGDDTSTFVAVANITGIPSNKQTGTDLTLNGTVEPENATNKTIVWSVSSAGTTGATITSGVLKTTATGTVKVTATITNGASATTNYTQDFTINVVNELPAFVAVTNITGVPSTATVNTNLTLSGTVAPATASNKTIVWTIASTNALTTATISGSTFKATTAGTATVTAKIVNGKTETSDYTKDFTITVSATPNDPRPSSPESMSGKTALQYFIENDIKAGWNLGNTLDAVNVPSAATETAWGQPAATQALFNGVKESGFDIVRIPVTWIGHIGPALDYTVSEARLRRVAEVVNYARTAGFKAIIINIHHDGNNTAGNNTTWGFVDMPGAVNNATKKNDIQNQLSKVWTQIAEYFKNYGDYLIFETLNEVHNGNWGNSEWVAPLDYQKEQDILFDWNQAALSAIRATGGNNATRFVAVPGLGSTEPPIVIAAHNRNKLLPNDGANGTGKLIVAVHFYDPPQYTVASSTVGQAEGGLIHTWGSPAEKSKLNHEADLLRTTFIDQGIAVYWGEWGAPTDERASMSQEIKDMHLDYITSMATAARANYIPPIYWDADVFKILERSNGRPKAGFWTTVLNAMMTAINNTTPGSGTGGDETGDGGTALGFDWVTNFDSATSSISANVTSGTITMTGSIGGAQDSYASIVGTPDASMLAAIKSATQFTLTVTGDGNSYRVMLVTPESETTGEYNHYGKDFTTTGGSSTVTITIAELAQQAGWGGTVSFIQNNVKGIQIQKAGSGAFNLTVSNIQFE